MDSRSGFFPLCESDPSCLRGGVGGGEGGGEEGERKEKLLNLMNRFSAARLCGQELRLQGSDSRVVGAGGCRGSSGECDTERLFNGPLFPHHALLSRLLLDKRLFVLLGASQRGELSPYKPFGAYTEMFLCVVRDFKMPPSSGAAACD